MSFTLTPRDVHGETRWRWELVGDDRDLRAGFEVDLDAGSEQYRAFADFSAYLDADRREHGRLDENERVHWLGTWIGQNVLGRPLWQSLRDTTVVVRDAGFLLHRPLELAVVEGETLARRGVALVRDLGSEAAHDPVGEDQLRMLALFLQPAGRPPIDGRRERWVLEDTIRRITMISRSRIDLAVLQHDVTRKALTDAAEIHHGWDVLHVSGCGAAGAVTLPARGGTVERISAGDLADLFRPTRKQLKLVVVTAGDGAQHVAEEFRRRLGVVAVTMRYPITDGFAAGLARHLYPTIFEKGQPVARAVALALKHAAGSRPTAGRPALSAGAPLLLGTAALDLRLVAPTGRTSLPPRSFVRSVGQPRSAEVVGRSELLTRASLALALDSGRSGVVLYGPAGTGKTSCATELMYCQHDPDGLFGRFRNVAWWRPETSAGDHQANLRDLAGALERQLDWPADWAKSPAILDRWLVELDNVLRDGRFLLVLDGLHPMQTRTGSWRDPQFETLINHLCGHHGHSRVILTVHEKPPGLPESVLPLAVAPLPAADLTRRLLSVPRLGHMFAGSGNDALLQLLGRWPALMNCLLAEQIDAEAVLAESKRWPLADEDADILADFLAAMPEPLSPTDEETVTAALAQLPPDGMRDLLARLNKPVEGTVPEMVGQAQRSGWTRPLVRLAANTLPQLRPLDERLAEDITAAAWPPPATLMTATVCTSEDGTDLAARLRRHIDRTSVPVQLREDGGQGDLLLVLLTAGSAAAGSACHEAARAARRAGLDVIVLRGDTGVRWPDWTRDLDRADCPGDRESDWRQVDYALRFLGSAERRLGQLRSQAQRLTSSDHEPAGRVAALDEITRRIADTELEIDDPAGAQRRRDNGIRDGKARRAQPAQPRGVPPRPRCYGEPPPVPEAEFKDREQQLRRLKELLSERAGPVAVLGPAGIGKTGLISRLLADLRAGAKGLDADGFVYLPAHGVQPVNALAVLQALVSMVDANEQRTALNRRLKGAVHFLGLLEEVLSALRGTTVIVVIDNAEELLGDDGEFTCADLRDVADRLREDRDHDVRIILVSRGDGPGRIPAGTIPIRLDDGLEAPDADAFFRAMCANRGVDLGADPAADLARLQRLTGGSPRALELCFGLLAAANSPSVRDLADLIDRDHPADVVEFLLRRSVKALDIPDQRIVQAVAIFGRPVTPPAVDELLRDHLHGVPSSGRLAALHRRRLVRQATNDTYYVPPMPDRDVILRTIPREAPGRPEGPDRYVRRALFARAADHYADFAKPDDDVTAVHDLRAHFAEIELRIRAEQYPKALSLSTDLDRYHLHRRGLSGSLLPFIERDLRNRFAAESREELDRLCELVWIYGQLEEHQSVITYGEMARDLARRSGEHATEVGLLQQLALSYLDAGETNAAARHYRLMLRRSVVWDRHARLDRAAAHHGIGICRTRTGEFVAALRSFRRAGRLLAKISEPDAPADAIELAQARASRLADSAEAHHQSGDSATALRAIQEAREAATHGLRPEMGRIHYLHAQMLIDLRDFTAAAGQAEHAAGIGVETGDLTLCRDARTVLALAYLCDRREEAAAQVMAAADRSPPDPENLVVRGLVAYRCGRLRPAEAAFEGVARYVDTRRRSGDRDYLLFDFEGLALAGLALIRGQQDLAIASCAAYSKARRRTADTGVVNRCELLLDQLPDRGDLAMRARIRAAANGAVT